MSPMVRICILSLSLIGCSSKMERAIYNSKTPIRIERVDGTYCGDGGENTLITTDPWITNTLYVCQDHYLYKLTRE